MEKNDREQLDLLQDTGNEILNRLQASLDERAKNISDLETEKKQILDTLTGLVNNH